jgi:hypothetical protein
MEQETTKPKDSNKFKNKKVIGAVAVFVILVILGGGFIFVSHSNAPTSSSPEDEIASEDLPTLSPEDIGMVVTVRPDNQALMFEIGKPDDIKGIEYTIEYEKEIDGEKVPEGIFGLMNIGEDGITKTDYREFGTCSAGKCRYDDVVSDVTLVLKVTKKDGKVYQVKKVVKLQAPQ